LSKFVVFGSQRTGSNLLVSYLNQFEDINCNGEFFNPSFVGIDKKMFSYFGLTREDVRKRDEQKLKFLSLIFSYNKCNNGFIFFPGHGNDIFNELMRDTNVLKVFLRKNPIQSYVSLKIAQKTDVWLIGNVVDKKKRDSQIEKSRCRITFNSQDYERYLYILNSFRNEFDKLFEKYGGRKFEIWYAQLNDHDIINELAGFLGSQLPPIALHQRLIKQNPQSLKEKVINYNELAEYAKNKNKSHLL